MATGAKILGSITVGENSKVGAGSVVLKEVPPNATVVGIPGKVVMLDGVRIGEKNKNVQKLDHQNIPDPMGDRCDYLEKTIEQLREEIVRMQKEDVK